MLSIEEIKLLIEKLERAKKEDLQQLIDTNLKILKELESTVNAVNTEIPNRLEKTPRWFYHDLKQKRIDPMKWEIVDEPLRRSIQLKIFQFAKTNIYNSLEIGPGNGMFSMDFRAWGQNYFLDVLADREQIIRKKFPPAHQKYLKFYTTKDTYCSELPSNCFNFVFSWDTFVFFTKEQIKKYLSSMNNILIPGAFCLIQYADCHYDLDLQYAKRGYWNYNTKTTMSKLIQDAGYKIIEMNMYRPGNSYAVFQKPGKQNPVTFKVSEITLD
jgi:hypothetical protein